MSSYQTRKVAHWREAICVANHFPQARFDQTRKDAQFCQLHARKEGQMGRNQTQTSVSECNALAAKNAALML